MIRPYAADLRRLERLRFEFGPGVGRERRAIVARLARSRFGRAADLVSFHESLLVARAYPDDAATQRAVDRALRAFAARRDLAVLRSRLAGSGIAGTDIPFRFFAPTALRLAARWPERLRFDWSDGDDSPRLEELLPLLAAEAEIPALDEWDLGLRGWLDRMRGPRTSDAAFFLRRLGERVRDPVLFEKLVDGVDAPMMLRLGPGWAVAHARALACIPGRPPRVAAATRPARPGRGARPPPALRDAPFASRRRAHGRARAATRWSRAAATWTCSRTATPTTCAWWIAATACSSRASARCPSAGCCSNRCTGSSR